MKKMMPTVKPFRPESYEQGTSREWLVTNGLGGYASATAIGCTPVPITAFWWRP